MVFNVFYSKDGLGKWVASIKGDYGINCSSHGHTPSLAQSRLRDALSCLIGDEKAYAVEFLDVYQSSSYH